MVYVPGVYETSPPAPDPLTILTTNIPNGIEGQKYPTVTFQGAGGVPPYQWALVAPNNVLPTGMTFSTAGVLEGTPTQVGSFPLNFRLRDAVTTDVFTGVLNFEVSDSSVLTVTTTTLPAVVRGVAYSQQLQAISGTPPYTWALAPSSAALPTGLSLSTGGLISGTPTVAGTSAVEFKVEDAVAATDLSGIINLEITQVSNPVITTGTTLGQGEVGKVYNRQLTNTGGWPPFTWSVVSGTLPAGIILDGIDGVLEGTPTTAGTSVFELEVKDSEARTGIKTFSLNVIAAGLEGPHDYWNALVADPTHFQSYSLRNQAQIDNLSPASVNTQCQYLYDIPGGDTANDPQDAMKITFPVGANASGINGVNIVHIGRGQYGGVPWNITPATPDTVLLIWDTYWDASFRDNCGNITHVKSVGIQMNNGTWWTMMQSPGPGKNSADPTTVAIRADVMTGPGAQPLGTRTTTGDWSAAWFGDTDNHNGGWEWAEGVWEVDNFAPTGPGARQQRSYTYPWGVTYQACAPLKQNMWHRYIIEIRAFQDPSAFTDWNAYIAPYESGEPHVVTANKLHVSGTWHMVSAWVYREDGTSDCTMFRAPVSYGTHDNPILSSMRFTMESSKHGNDGPQHGYMRNFVMLRNYTLPATNPESDTFIFKYPVR